MRKRNVPIRFTGQHFTVDTVLIKDAIHLIDLQKDDTVLDIGAGSGFLTVHLMKYSENVIVIENDRRLVSELKSKFKMNNNVMIAGIDYRKFSVPQKTFKVVSNIPYSITSEILKSLMYHNFELFNQGCLIVQLDCARKLVRRKYFNPYLIFYHTFFKIELIYEISPNSFMPPPKVKSALLKITKKKYIDVIDVEQKVRYLDFLHFMMKYPDLPLRTVLKKLFRKEQVRILAQTYNIMPEKPVQVMSAENFLRCFASMLEIVPVNYQPIYS
ncbi:rRNA adenine methyltransferase [Sphingobacterium sp. DK4209]|uniref:rRNA adenine methyltransferase n=1 Tax=Sphingobacterium zhuxiongii TaxID=2662364 RepID=A0A5Q0Q957_9SPHI|nr:MULTISPECIES: rRNA adenine N-6-methyltransferase family protein [unclassified Sphingobacterium]MVZ67584.1 rRNA adenine methyltransferase [Sphingobacterium sp. DK4209]QGA26475.1 rRNA adenine methyltransferase [Sphingobacterium sp. dk4302]